MRSLLALLGFLFPLVAAAEAPTRVGVIVPLTGPIANMGHAFKRGVTMYVEEHAADTSGVEFVFEDGAYDPTKTLSAFHKLRSSSKASLIVVWGNTPSGACTPVAEKVGMPLLAISYNPDAKGKSHVITFGPTTESLIGLTADRLRQWNIRRPAMVSVDFGNAMIAIEMLKRRLNGELDVTLISGDESDFKTIITRLRHDRVTGMVLFAGAAQSLTFINQAAQLSFKPKLIGADTFGEESFKLEVQGKLPEVVFPALAASDAFIERVRKRWGEASSVSETAAGYSVAAIVDRARAKFQDGVMSALTSVDTSNLPAEGLRFVEDEERGRHFDAVGRMYTVAKG